MPVSILRRALEQGSSHAYLLAGPAGAGKSEAAIALAAGLACDEAGCGVCGTCRRVQAGLHPDVEIVAPEGNLLRREQIVEINIHASYRPYEAKAKVYVLQEADSLNAEAANAFLKTLEEPPSHVYFILVSDHPEKLLPTITSRCQMVSFGPVARAALVSDLKSRFDMTAERAELLARVSGGNLTYCRELATSESAQRQRDQLLDLVAGIPRARPLDLLVAVDEIMDTIEKRASENQDVLAEDLAKALEWAGDARTRKWLEKRHADKVKRQQRRLTSQGLQTVTRVFAGWYRDLALVAAGADGAVLNLDRVEQLREQAQPGLIPAYEKAVRAVRQAQDRLRYNVDSRSAIADMFRSIKGAQT